MQALSRSPLKSLKSLVQCRKSRWRLSRRHCRDTQQQYRGIDESFSEPLMQGCLGRCAPLFVSLAYQCCCYSSFLFVCFVGLYAEHPYVHLISFEIFLLCLYVLYIVNSGFTWGPMGPGPPSQRRNLIIIHQFSNLPTWLHLLVLPFNYNVARSQTRLSFTLGHCYCNKTGRAVYNCCAQCNSAWVLLP